MNKLITFSEFKFHLLPLEENQLPIEFNGPVPTYDNLVKEKNIIFQDILKKLDISPTDKNLFQLIHSEDDIYLFKISNQKNTRYVEKFKLKELKMDPCTYLIVDNKGEEQKIYISEDKGIFKTPITTKNVLLKVFKRHLRLEFLNITIEEVFDKKNFWSLVNLHKNKITHINFEIIKPGETNVPSSMFNGFQDFVGKSNAYESNILLKAPKDGILKNIDKSNRELGVLIEHSSKTGGDIKIKVVGHRKQFRTGDEMKKIYIPQNDLEESNQHLIKMYKEAIRK